MRNALTLLAASLLATSALAQVTTTTISTSPAAAPSAPVASPPAAQGAISSSTLSPPPFGAQKPYGDGVAPAPAATPPMPTAAPGGGILGVSKAFDEADTNRDGAVTREEFIAKADRHFGIADTNKDGKITRDEMNAQEQKMMQQVQQKIFKGDWGSKLNQFMGGGAKAAPAPTPAGTMAQPSSGAGLQGTGQ